MRDKTYNLSSGQGLMRRVAELQLRSEHLDALYRPSIAKIEHLSQRLDQLVSADNKPSWIGFEAQHAVQNVSARNSTTTIPALQLPSAADFLPHLSDGAALRPAFCMCGARRSGVSMVLGVPTVRRAVQDYLLGTLDSLVSSMTPEESRDALIVVFVAETDVEYVMQLAGEIRDRFGDEVQSGLIELISPPASFYPDPSSLRLTLGDSVERVRWRSKQNLDFAFLMMYAHPRGTLYVQLEDDIVTKRGFMSTMKNFALEKTAQRAPWFVLEFCQLGFIGKMFKSVDLPFLVQFFLMFYNDKPVDWLLDHFIFTKVCTPENNPRCQKAKKELWIQYKPSLFQHMGKHSSLRGKIQNLKDTQFGKLPLFFPHDNPPADVESDIAPYQQHTLLEAYMGRSYFWGLSPQPGNTLTFRFKTPVFIKRFLFRSGNAEHPSDKLLNTSVEVKPQENRLDQGLDLNGTPDGFLVIGQCNGNGVCEGDAASTLGAISVLRLHIHSKILKSVVLSEILIEANNGR
ncbi:alpha-1,3-mannosyl-glycoprotein 4-beta-N-acetylglucosaminyltransferase B-like isoform X2 [Thrips palmi]|uniref:Alpha-1,3-mannosyl-glycoprotein 4-beta-N-acetylglucosaminyltransferase B-like isoform X2 n=1 Tax=Thrips palmi TaxID=161013 RepID=A0A6P8ZNH0_THRPL|nr:alpha-1,3-mannosyl-glycoprotein 4-beta-N-acetylglucosaminyltransferase B-like isoform X2 [Thrips palmi]